MGYTVPVIKIYMDISKKLWKTPLTNTSGAGYYQLSCYPQTQVSLLVFVKGFTFFTLFRSAVDDSCSPKPTFMRTSVVFKVVPEVLAIWNFGNWSFEN